jgi:hypothetical protein
MPQAEHEWFSEQIEVIFGRGAQSAFARFLVIAGAGRSHSTVLRQINNCANGRVALSAEVIALLTVLRSTQAETKAMILEAIEGTRQNF